MTESHEALGPLQTGQTLELHPQRGDHESGPPPGVRVMAVVRWIVVALMAVLAALSVAYSTGRIDAKSASASETQYYCPMHPQVVKDHPGECPICGMSLVPKPAAGEKKTVQPEPPPGAAAPTPKSESAATSAAQNVPGLVPVDLSLDRVQLIGMRTARATPELLGPELRTVGFVSANESKIARVHTRFAGWIERLAVATTGEKVRRGQTLAGIYNLELLPAQQEFLTARSWNSGASAGKPSSTATSGLEQDARGRLGLLGMSRGEIDRVASSGKVSRTIAVSSPIAGYVVRKDAVQGAFVQPGTELFEIADLSKVWVLADVYEYEIARVSVGQKARVEIAAYPQARFEGKIGFIYPTVDPDTRTLRVRLELDNKDMRLRPGMYGDVIIELGQSQGVVVPSEALVDTGELQYVFIAKEGGRFEPRRVRVGARTGDKVQILEGVSPGETVVTTANFLIDSESRLHAAIEGAPAADQGATPKAAPPSRCDADFDRAKFPDKYAACRACAVHRGMGSMEEDCVNAIAKPWR